jgi:hypothetical protein
MGIVSDREMERQQRQQRLVAVAVVVEEAVLDKIGGSQTILDPSGTRVVVFHDEHAPEVIVVDVAYGEIVPT